VTKTALDKMIQLQKIANVDADKQARHFELLMQWLQVAGFEHYEISNFAKPGHRSRHNSSYWQGKTYLGLGPSPHSFNGNSRQWNIAYNALYVASISKQIVPFEIEELSQTQQLNEYIKTSLRTIEGLSIQKVQQSWGDKALIAIMQDAELHLHVNYMVQNDQYLCLTKAGRLLADGIAADLFQ
jgi:oxygen-independent coproporphyrinogen-3 oxidase